jgi:2-methylcitrate dehydratase PrpD
VLLASFEQSFRIRETYCKPYASCRHSHSAIDAALALVAPEGLHSSRIRDVEVRVYGIAIQEADRPRFTNLIEADNSLQYAVAVALRHGDFALARRSLDTLRDPDIIALAGKVRVVHEAKFDQRFPDERPARVTLTTADGAVRSIEIAVARGEPENPMSAAEIGAKTMEIASPVIGEEGVHALLTAVATLPQANSIAGLVSAARLHAPRDAQALGR